jgi:hypothetical protein
MSTTLLYSLFSDKSMIDVLFYSFLVCLSFPICRAIEAPTFANLQGLEEQDFEQVDGVMCP